MNNKDNSQSVFLHYIFLLTAIFGVLVPHVFVSGMSLSFIVCLIIFAYAQRLDYDSESLMWNHMTYIIQTFWYGLLVLSFSLLFAVSVFLLSFKHGLMDTRPLGPCMIDQELSPCMRNFFEANPYWFFSVSLIVFGPVILYFLFRYARGLIFVKKNLAVGNITGTFYL